MPLEETDIEIIEKSKKENNNPESKVNIHDIEEE